MIDRAVNLGVAAEPDVALRDLVNLLRGHLARFGDQIEEVLIPVFDVQLHHLRELLRQCLGDRNVGQRRGCHAVGVHAQRIRVFS